MRFKQFVEFPLKFSGVNLNDPEYSSFEKIDRKAFLGNREDLHAANIYGREPQLKYFELVSKILSKHDENWIVYLFDESRDTYSVEQIRKLVPPLLRNRGVTDQELADSIVFVKKGSTGDPLTPKWMLFHCLGHALFDTKSPAKRKAITMVNAIDEFIIQYLRVIGDNTYKILDFLPFASASRNSGRKSLNDDMSELRYELIAYYINSGKITFSNSERTAKYNVPDGVLNILSENCTNIVKECLQLCVGHILVD